MSRHKRNSVRILNRVSGPGYTTHKKALMYVRAGRARFGRDAQGEYLEFDQEHQRNQLVSVCAAMSESDVVYDRAVANGSGAGRSALKLTYREKMGHNPYTLKRVTKSGRGSGRISWTHKKTVHNRETCVYFSLVSSREI